VITGLASVGLPLGRGLLLLAEMSTEGSLATGSYTEDAVRMAREHRDFVIGFIAQRRMDHVGGGPSSQPDVDHDFIILTPGVSLDTSGDAMGQQYRTPERVVGKEGCDVIIVGRGIYGKGTGDALDVGQVELQAEKYQTEGWNAYLKRIESGSTAVPAL
jgi:orotidine-5'-phosphate decarboxylase